MEDRTPNPPSHLRTSHHRTHHRTIAPSHRRTGSGFTLIELMVVMSLIVILASIGLTVYTNSVIRAKESVLKEDLFRMRDAIDQYYATRGSTQGRSMRLYPRNT
jgi:prepilin-type N-terminal cleavage/methylation domain-containing protein